MFKTITLGQTILNVKPIVQRDPSWCWAATMEMVIKYRGNDTLDQCEIVQNFNKGSICNCPETNCSCPQCLSCSSSNCSGGVTIAQLKSRLSTFAFNCQKKTTLSWNNIKAQINNGLPFILSLGCESGHLVTVRGFKKLPKTSRLKFMIVNDPFCCAGSSIAEIRYFDNSAIKPEQSYCYFIADIKQKSNYIQKIDLDTFNDCEVIRERISRNDTNALKVNYQIVNVTMNGANDKWIDVIKKHSCSGVYHFTRMKLINNFWEPVFIMQQKDNPIVPIAFFADGRPTALCNDAPSYGNSTTTYIPYSKVISKDSPYEIYAFEWQGTPLENKIPYFTPAHVNGEVLINGAYFKGGSVYMRKDINFILPNLGQSLNKSIKNPFSSSKPTTIPKIDKPIKKTKRIQN